MKLKYLLAYWLIFCSFGLSYCESCSGSQEISFEEKIHNLEDFLERQVPGLTVSYNTVIQALIDEGWDVYIRGGATRDLLASIPKDPNDIDIDYSGTPEELKALLDGKQWQYTQLPGSPIITIGSMQGIYIEAVPLSVAFGQGESSLEFTVTNIFYHSNQKALAPGAEVGLEDLSFRRLRILTPNLKAWLYRNEKHPYERIYRSWNMIGKGFVYSTAFAHFLKEQAEEKIQNNPDLFQKEMLHYLKAHYENFDNVYHGAIAIMGYDWAQGHVLPLREDAKKQVVEREKRRGQFTRFIHK